MPYIQQAERKSIDLNRIRPSSPGSLNYAMTMTVINNLEDPALILSKLELVGDLYLRDMGVRYAFINDVVGALHCAAREFKRRTGIRRFDDLFKQAADEFYDRHAPQYEDKKIAENGDCYPADLVAAGRLEANALT